MKNEEIARIAHEVNRAFCESIGDNSQVEWENAADWQRQSAIDGVGRFIANPEVTAEETHERWMQHKLENGWRHGPVKDEEKQEHPSLIPYNELPLHEKTKDYLFRGVVSALLKA